ncbi:MAG: ribosome maturation factor RimP [Gammaproteobacteria bacterium]|nr:ribosome maturation factor RimP [Gammaproteobacteria bacterium]
MQRASDKIWRCVEPVVTSLGYEFVGAEYGQGESGNTLRVYIDKEGGILLDDCALVSNQLSAVLDVEEPIQSHYVLEVSSPGIERPLFKPADFIRFTGQKVKLRTYSAVLGRRNFSGMLESVEKEEIFLEVDGEVFAISLTNIEWAKLLPEF